MPTTRLRSWPCVLGLILTSALTLRARASAFVSGAYYRLGDDDPGAVSGAVGNDPTLDSFTSALNLSRVGAPHYSSNTPAGYTLSKLSMAFANEGLGGPSFLGYYTRPKPLPTDQGYAIEAWVNTPTISPLLDPPTAPHLIAYNGTPGTDGFGLYEIGGQYVARLGATDHPLGPTGDDAWHHVAYIQSFDNASFYYDGKLVSSTTGDPTPLAPTGAFWLGGRNLTGDDTDLFNGYIDEVRYQAYNPIAAGAFEPASFLIDAPEPSAIALLGLAISFGTLRRRKLRSL
jgi:hypothetical protein